MKKKVSKKTQLKNPFYIASPMMNADVNRDKTVWAKPTLEAAIDHAKERFNDPRHKDVDTYLIVKVVAIVRRKQVQVPTIVEKVK